MNTEELYKRCHELFEVVDGELIRKIGSGTGHIGDVAGSHNSKGYIAVKLGGKARKAHRLIFLMGHGYEPEQVDHINGKKDDNRLCNLRAATNASNQRNSPKKAGRSCKYNGVCLLKLVRSDVYLAFVNLNGKTVQVGRFKDPVFAANAVDVFNRKHNQEFSTFNFPKENERPAL